MSRRRGRVLRGLVLNNERHHDYKRRHMIKYKLNSFATHTGNTIIPPHAGVTCIVGANHTGKSQLLSDLLQYMQHGPLHSQPAVILKNASRLFDQPAPEEIDEWVSKTLIKINGDHGRSEEHTSELQSRGHIVCRLLLEKKKL